MNRNYTKKKLALIAFLPLLLVSKTFSQFILQNAANDAYAITRMVDRFHVQPKPVNDTFSEDVYRMVIKKLDPRKIFFTKQDITTLNPYIHLLDDEIKTKNPAFIQLLSNIYRQRVKQTDSIIDEVGKKPFNFSLKEKLTVTEDTSYAENSAALRIKIYKMMKLTTAHSIAEDYPKKASLAIQKKYTDSIEPITREHITASLKRNFKEVIEKENGLEKEVGNSYCESIANCFDPHSDYFPKEENFNNIKKAFDAKSPSDRTHQDVNAYNKAIKDINNEINISNQNNNEMNNLNAQILNSWSSTEKTFMDNNMPYFKK